MIGPFSRNIVPQRIAGLSAPTSALPLLRNRLLREWVILALLATALVAALSATQITGRFDNLIYDYVARWIATTPSDDVAIVAIDEASLAEFGRWPWSREKHVQLLERLQEARVRAVGMDILLSEPGDPANDAALATAIAQGPPIVLPVEPISPGSNGRSFDLLRPLPSFANAIATNGATGHVMVVPDNDGVVRRITPCLTSENQHTPHFTLSLRAIAAGKPQPDCAPNANAEKMLPFLELEEFTVISYTDLVHGRTPAGLLEGRVVLVGATASGLGDQFAGGGGARGKIAGVTILANTLITLENDGFIEEIRGVSHLLLALLPVWFLLIGLWHWTPGQVMRIATILALGTLVLCLLALQQGHWFAPGATLAGLVFVYPFWGWRRLQATSDYMGGELVRMEHELQQIPLPQSAPLAADVVADQAQRLSAGIGQLRDLRQFVGDALASLPDPMLVTDHQWSIRLANPAAHEMFGHPLEGSDLIEQLYLLALPDQARDMHEWLIKQTTMESPESTLDSTQESHFELKSRQGRVFAMRATVLAQEAAKGDQRGYILYLADITALTTAQHEREHVLQLLSHDMRAPLASILALLNQPAGRLTALQRNQRIEVQTRRTLSLADNFVDLARMEATEFSPDDLLLSELVAEAADGLFPLAGQRNITIATQDESEMAFVRGEGSSLFRAFTNLIDNALRYSPEGGKVTIRLFTQSPAPADHVGVTISDEGEGIADHLLDQLFARFAASSDGAKVRSGGIGLGLHYVASVVARHGGTIEAANLPRGANGSSGGAIFSVFLPFAPAEEDGILDQD